MLDSLSLHGYRSFSELQIDDLSQINLFVGKNNCGKTTILEAAELLVCGSDPSAIISSSSRRGELGNKDRPDNRSDIWFDVSHLFFGHKLELGSEFSIQGILDSKEEFLSCRVSPQEDFSDNNQTLSFQDKLFPLDDELGPVAVFSVEYSSQKPFIIPLSPQGGIPRDYFRRLALRESGREHSATFIRTESLDSLEMGELWDAIALTEEENNIIQTLRVLEPSVDRIAFLSKRMPRFYGSSTAGIVVKLKNVEMRVPLGSLGDGVKHLLGICLAVMRSSKGIVLIDEIDTGLHYSMMIDMWKILIETALRLNVQIFATTHSLDCVRSLAWLYEESPNICDAIRLHRLEKDRNTPVTYKSQEIATAVKQMVELRG